MGIVNLCGLCRTACGDDAATSSTFVNKVWHCGRVPKTLPEVDVSAPICCSPVAAGPAGDDAALEIALRLKALADPVRVKVMSLLFSSAAGEECGCDLASAVGLAESTLSHHLTQLRRAGFIESERRGMNVYHRARRESLTALCSVLDPACCR
jgi:ArsR family transcriptional regulator, arsenate/arsenite/antimonite-responsive transcriptional repressor